MPTHPYCLVASVERVPASLLGVDGAPVRALVVDDVSMWVSDAPTLAAGTTVERVQRHQEVVRHHDVVMAALDLGTTPVPVRFGQRFASDDEARRYLAEKLPDLRHLFERVAGMVEMSVIVAPALARMLRELTPIAPAALDAMARGAGREYLEQLRERTSREQAVRSLIDAQLDRVSAAVRALSRGEERQVSQRPVGVIAHLVASSDALHYRESVLALPAAKEWQLLVSGPRAPYSFCAVGDENTGGTFLAT
jgi:hypothetical protein